MPAGADTRHSDGRYDTVAGGCRPQRGRVEGEGASGAADPFGFRLPAEAGPGTRAKLMQGPRVRLPLPMDSRSHYSMKFIPSEGRR